MGVRPVKSGGCKLHENIFQDVKKYNNFNSGVPQDVHHRAALEDAAPVPHLPLRAANASAGHAPAKILVPKPHNIHNIQLKKNPNKMTVVSQTLVIA